MYSAILICFSSRKFHQQNSFGWEHYKFTYLSCYKLCSARKNRLSRIFFLKYDTVSIKRYLYHLYRLEHIQRPMCLTCVLAYSMFDCTRACNCRLLVCRELWCGNQLQLQRIPSPKARFTPGRLFLRCEAANNPIG